MLKILKSNEFKKTKHSRALFFSLDGICVDKNNDTPFIQFEDGAKHFKIQTIIEDDDILIVQGVLSLNTNTN